MYLKTDTLGHHELCDGDAPSHPTSQTVRPYEVQIREKAADLIKRLVRSDKQMEEAVSFLDSLEADDQSAFKVRLKNRVEYQNEQTKAKRGDEKSLNKLALWYAASILRQAMRKPLA